MKPEKTFSKTKSSEQAVAAGRSSIDGKIEIQKVDSMDRELLPYLSEFLDNWNKKLVMPPISLLTTEDAKKAAIVCEQQLKELEHQTSIIRALRRALS